MYTQRPESHRMYYIAILCPKEIDEKVYQLKEWMRKQFGCMVALKSPGHITLIPPFWMDEAKEDELTATLHQFSNEETPSIELNCFSHFSDRVLFIQVNGNEQLANLRNKTEEYFLKSFTGIIKKDERPFHPHVTIANRDMKPSAFVKAWEHFSKTEFTETFIADSISLLKLIDGKWKVIGEKRI
jgi:2'-5' RNA ligase